jgi:leucyl-tRNA synthetase
MAKSYSPKDIEPKWQKYWEENKTFEVKNSGGEKYYCLVEFPYPSGEGLHVGHPRSYTAMDIIARKRRMQGYDVLYPIGFDAFGLPAENYAIKTGVHPAIKTEENISNFRRQLKSLGLSFDWSREISTTDPKYYKWTQWIFLKLFEKGLAYKHEMAINFCTGCKVGLSNEEVVNGLCERCGGQVVKKIKKQWMLKITEYADRLEKDLDDVDYISQVKTQQKNWIGRSEGAEVDFAILGESQKIKVYTTRPDTLFGATYMVLSPEHGLIEELKDKITNFDEVQKYIIQASKKSDLERTELSKDKTGVELKGLKAINPLNDFEIPVWISDYVLVSYGTGAIMAVPAHDQRDYEFASKFNLNVVEVIAGGDISKEAYTDITNGQMVNSDFLNGLSPQEATSKTIEFLEQKNIGKKSVNYKLRDWVFSRQRYWGEPIPIVDCAKCGFVPLSESDLPLELPEVKEFTPGEDGESPLAKLDDWVNVKCPKCDGPARRETDTMPQWAGSSWYFLRYIDPNNDQVLASAQSLKDWTPVDWYNGGMEHTTLHLLYSRFWHKFLFDIGVVPTSEPYSKRTSHGMILGEGGDKMSKSRGNVINPDDIVAEYGADTFRLYEMFMGPFDSAIPWDTKGVVGVKRFLDKVWSVYNGDIKVVDNIDTEVEILFNKTIKKVTEDIESMGFNTAISALMILVNSILEAKQITKDIQEKLLIILSPFAPHLSEDLWQELGHDNTIAFESWPQADGSKLQSETVEIVVQVNGKVRAKLLLSPDVSQDEAVIAAQADSNVQKHLDNREIKKTIFVPGRLISFVI